jgi:hypothetical protein
VDNVMSGPLDCERDLAGLAGAGDCCGAKLGAAGVVSPRPVGWCNETLHRWFGGFGRSPVTLLVGLSETLQRGTHNAFI